MSRVKAPESRLGHANSKPLATRKPRLAALPASAGPSTSPVPPAPPAMGPVALRAWSRIWRVAGSAYQPATDFDVVEVYCGLLQDRADLRRIVAEEGHVLPSGNMAAPAARLLSDVEKRIVTLSDRLGLNPEARMRMGLTQMKAISELDRFTGEIT